jgi:predicted RecA/RadA family phage recombinase
MMATAVFVHEGDTIDYTPGSAVAAGDVVVQGELLGVAKQPIAANALGALAVKGVFDFPKATGGGTAITAGTKLYWDVADQEAKADEEAGANKLIGKAVADAGDSDATVRVRLSQ